LAEQFISHSKCTSITKTLNSCFKSTHSSRTPKVANKHLCLSCPKRLTHWFIL